ncbi:hypothetical protein [Pseudomonas moraviensis]|uniref:hypothetical protein n=1 Tax=Pseudomonas moraviensis TaxID=321662 RepID=UPI003F53F3B1
MSVFPLGDGTEVAPCVGNEDELGQVLFQRLGVHVGVGLGQMSKSVGVGRAVLKRSDQRRDGVLAVLVEDVGW